MSLRRLNQPASPQLPGDPGPRASFRNCGRVEQERLRRSGPAATQAVRGYGTAIQIEFDARAAG
ncbi:MAG: hypothetical protein U5Q44_12395 [Dehalococcoidia bacterium]|nr:hypothetical protein [Dehalococcoidia bacterium]